MSPEPDQMLDERSPPAELTPPPPPLPTPTRSFRVGHGGGRPVSLTVSDSLLRPLVMKVKPCVSMATPVFCMCSSTYLKRKATGIRGGAATSDQQRSIRSVAITNLYVLGLQNDQ